MAMYEHVVLDIFIVIFVLRLFRYLCLNYDMTGRPTALQLLKSEW